MRVAQLLEDHDAPILVDIIMGRIEKGETIRVAVLPSGSDHFAQGKILKVSMGTTIAISRANIRKVVIRYHDDMTDNSEMFWVTQNNFEKNFTLKKQDGFLTLVDKYEAD